MAFIYFVVDAHLSAPQLVVLGTVVSVTLGLCDIPAGAWADAIGRRWSLAIGHGFLAAGMMMTAFVTAYPLIVTTQVLWGLGWAFSGGADVAWLTDEFDRPDRLDRLLVASARLSLIGAVVGIVAAGVLGWVSGLATAIAVCGIGMAALGVFVAVRFDERNFGSAPRRSWTTSVSILRRGLGLALSDNEILLILAATVISEGASIVGWLFPRQLVDLGVHDNAVLWWTAIGGLSFGAGAVALRLVETRIDGVGAVRWTYSVACFIGLIALLMLAYTRNIVIGGIGMLLAWGIVFNVTRAVSVIWVNRRTSSDVRATVLSCLSQAKSIGGIVGGSALAILAKATDISVTFTVCGVLFAVAGVIVAWYGADRTSTTGAK